MLKRKRLAAQKRKYAKERSKNAAKNDTDTSDLESEPDDIFQSRKLPTLRKEQAKTRTQDDTDYNYTSDFEEDSWSESDRKKEQKQKMEEKNEKQKQKKKKKHDIIQKNIAKMSKSPANPKQEVPSKTPAKPKEEVTNKPTSKPKQEVPSKTPAKHKEEVTNKSTAKPKQEVTSKSPAKRKQKMDKDSTAKKRDDDKQQIKVFDIFRIIVRVLSSLLTHFQLILFNSFLPECCSLTSLISASLKTYMH